MIYDKQPNDKRYRLVNLKAWDRENKWQEFSSNHIENNNRYIMLEIEREDGTIELRESGVAKEKVFWNIAKDGKVTITFQSENALKEGPFLGHLYLQIPDKNGIRYAFPRIDGEKISNRLECVFQLMPNSEINELQVVGDKYFEQVFVLEKNI